MTKNWTWNSNMTSAEKIESFTRSAEHFRKLGRWVLADGVERIVMELKAIEARSNESA